MRKSIRILCLLLCLLLTCSSALAADYTMPEKMRRQIDVGSGVKGAVSLAVAGGSEWLDLLLPFTGSDLQVRYIVKGEQFQAQLYALDDQEQQRALTQAYGDDAHLYLRSELIPDTVLTLPIGSELMDLLFGGSAENPTFYSAVQALLKISDDEWEKYWVPVLSPYESALEQWATAFASEPSITQSDSGSSSMTLRYVIPADALKAAMKDLMSQFLQDAALLELAAPLLTDAQQALYLNPNLGYYYDAVIDSLPLTGDVTMVRTLSTRGDVLESALTLPLPENVNGWTALTCTITDRDTALMLAGDAQSITLVIQETAVMSDRTTWNGIFRYIPETGKAVSASFSLSKQFSTWASEENGYTHESTDWALTASSDLSHLESDDPDRARYAEFYDISVALNTHYYSRGQYNDPTTLEATLSANLPSLSIDMSTALRTTSPWVLSNLPTDGAESLLGLSEERKAELLAEFSRNAALTMTSLTSQTTDASSEETEAESSTQPTLVPPAH